VIHKEFVPEWQTVNNAFSVKVLKRVPRVRPQFRAEGSWFLLHDNVPFTFRNGSEAISGQTAA
jgi:hypothetical protein